MTTDGAERDDTDSTGGLHWRKSSRSKDGGCVEVAFDKDCILVRDSKDRTGPTLRFNLAEWRVLLASIREGDLGSHNSR
jgi:hypothetical protein